MCHSIIVLHPRMQPMVLIYFSYLSIYCYWIACYLFISRQDHYLSNLFPFRSRLTILPLATSTSIIPPACPRSALRSPPSWPLL